MIGCMVINYSTTPSDTLVETLRGAFSEESLELNIGKDNTIIMYIWNCKKGDIWQLAFDLEMSNIKVGYGFGELKEDAEEKAIGRLKAINLEM